jgi:hypothetical protein
MGGAWMPHFSFGAIMPITPDLRTNLGTWAVMPSQVPAVAHFMHDSLPNEVFDPHFYGQKLITTYFDTNKLALRKARLTKDKYITLRVRCYEARGQEEIYALSAKTEEQKFRIEISSKIADDLIYNGKDSLQAASALLPVDLLGRLLEVCDGDKLTPIVNVFTQRYAIEDDQDRFTLDTAIKTDMGKAMTYSVLEFKSTKTDEPPNALKAINLHPIKLSKFLWSTKV